MVSRGSVGETLGSGQNQTKLAVPVIGPNLEIRTRTMPAEEATTKENHKHMRIHCEEQSMARAGAQFEPNRPLGYQEGTLIIIAPPVWGF